MNAQCSTFRGKQCPNKVLRGETDVLTDDTFISELIDNKGFVAMVFLPLLETPKMPCMNFNVIGTGTWETCIRAIESRAKAEGMSE